MSTEVLRQHARAIWDAALSAVRPEALLGRAFANPAERLAEAVGQGERIVVVGGGKAGASMAAALERVLADRIDRVSGIVNVPAEQVRPLSAIRLHAARPAGRNEPTAAGVAGTDQMLDSVASAHPGDVVLCLLSGGGSALLPAPANGIFLEDKQAVTRLLHASGATINDMNAVRKHLSRFKGGGLARASRGRLFSLIISDVVGDPLDVIASGPTAPDPTTYADALGVLSRYGLVDRVPRSVREHLKRGSAGEVPETLKVLPSHVHNLVLGNNAGALAAAEDCAKRLGYRVLNLGSFIEGETQPVAAALAGILRSISTGGPPIDPPACVLSGGETTVTLGSNPGKGGRNTEFVLAALLALAPTSLGQYLILSGGTDGEDGPTDAAGAFGDPTTLAKAMAQGIDPAAVLRQHDSYSLFQATGNLLTTGLTGTNVMDVRVMLIGGR